MNVQLKICFYFLLIFQSCAGIRHSLKESASLIANRHPGYIIVIPQEPTPVELSAAEELQAYLQKSTGFSLPIVKESQKNTKGI